MKRDQRTNFYFFYYARTRVVVEVSKKVFAKGIGPVVKYRKDDLCRIIGSIGVARDKEILRAHPQILDTIGDIVGGVQLVIAALNFIGKTKKEQLTALSSTQQFDMSMVLDILRLVIDLFSLTESLTVCKVISVLLSVFQVATKAQKMMQAQVGLEPILLSIASTMLPKQSTKL